MFAFIRKLFSKKVPATAPVKETHVHWGCGTDKYVVKRDELFIVRDAFHNQVFKSFSLVKAIDFADEIFKPSKEAIFEEQQKVREQLLHDQGLTRRNSREARPLNRQSASTNNNNDLLTTLVVMDMFTSPAHSSPSHCDSSSSSYDSGSYSCDSSSSSSD